MVFPKYAMKSISNTAISAFYFSICLLLLIGCKQSVEKTEENADEPNKKSTSSGIAVNTSLVRQETFNKQILANGLVEAKNKADIRFKIAERVAHIYVKNGEFIPKGKPIATLENQLLYNQLKRAEIDFETAKNKFREEKIRFGYGKVPIEKMDTVILQSLYIRTGYHSSKNLLENARILYEQTFLRAPFSGVVANLTAKEGNFMTSSDILCTLIDPKQLDIVFQVAENQLSFVKLGQKVSISPFADQTRLFEGRITEVNPMVDENGLIRIKATIVNQAKEQNLFDGMNVSVVINNPMGEMLMIPKAALVLRSGKEVVFTLQNGQAKWNYVTIFDENSDSYAIADGLRPNDTIIVSGNMNLAHDAKVTPTFLPSLAKQ
jgi:RND family efflux transporter MFP subunit